MTHNDDSDIRMRNGSLQHLAPSDFTEMWKKFYADHDRQLLADFRQFLLDDNLVICHKAFGYYNEATTWDGILDAFLASRKAVKP